MSVLAPGIMNARRWTADAALLALIGLTLAACAGGPPPAVGTGGAPSPRYSGYKVGQPYQVKGVWYYPREQPNYDEIGIASWYGEQFHNRYTADGEVFDMTLPSAAHKTLPLPSLVEVTNLSNGKRLIVRVNDRGPFVDGRVIDLSKAAAAQLGFVTAGLTRVRVRYVGRAPDPPGLKSVPDWNRPKIEQASAAPPPQAARPSSAYPASAYPSTAYQPSQSQFAVASRYDRSLAATPSTPPDRTAAPQAAQAPAPVQPAAPTAAIQPGPAAPPVQAPPIQAPPAGPALPDVDSLLADAPPAAPALPPRS